MTFLVTNILAQTQVWNICGYKLEEMIVVMKTYDPKYYPNHYRKGHHRQKCSIIYGQYQTDRQATVQKMSTPSKSTVLKICCIIVDHNPQYVCFRTITKWGSHALKMCPSHKMITYVMNLIVTVIKCCSIKFQWTHNNWSPSLVPI